MGAPDSRRGRRRLAGGIIAGAALAGVGVLIAQALSGERRVTVVRVITAPPQPASSAIPAAPAAPARALPPASAGSNGSAAVIHTAQAPTSPLRAGAQASFARLVASLPGQVAAAVAPLGDGDVSVLGDDVAAHGWSTTKVPVLAALLKAHGTQGLTAQEQQWAQAAITQSDNQSVLDLFGDLERARGGLVGASNYVQGLLRQSGDSRTIVATAPPPPGAVTTFGQTQWAPSDAAKFFRALGRGCLLSAAQTGYVLSLMENIAPSESWGLGAAGFGAPLAFKGGWGPEPSGQYLVRQSGIVDPGTSRGVAVAIVALPTATGGNSFETGIQMVTDTARWLRRELTLATGTAVGCSPS